LKPNESYNVEVVCNADDASKFSDTLFFIIKEGVDKEVQLKAKAIGSTIFCKNIENITFGTIYTHKAIV
jgi:hydrocephalus-inducing protein